MNHNDFITERELSANLKPLREDIWEIKADVKMLILRDAGNQAVVKQRRLVSDRFLAYTAIIGALIAPLAWGTAAHL